MMRKNAEARNNFRRVAAPILLALGLCLVLGVAPLSAAPPQNPNGQPTRADAIRFLEQATFGPTPELIDYVQSIGFEAWLEEQFSLPTGDCPDLYTAPFGCDRGPGQTRYCPQNQAEGCPDTLPPEERATCVRLNYTLWPLQQRFFGNALNPSRSSDQLRQRVAFALSQIVVVSATEPPLRLPQRMLPYLWVLDNNAFGRYRNLLYDISVNPAMGRYLDNVDNTAARPNENYAREILQLFSIGLDKLNNDGTLWPPGTPERVPTYEQETVRDFTKALTGWQFEAPPQPGILNYFDPLVPGAIARHDRTETPLLNCNPDGTPVDDYSPCVVLPADPNRTADQSLEVVLDNIINYPSIGPYISKNLIEHLVTSNPSPDYVQRVVSVFNDNGAGARGDLKAVVQAILLDPEARNPAPAGNFGHLKEPVLWIANVLRAFNITSDDTDYVLGERFLGDMTPRLLMDQDVYYSPTVFNYYPPGYQIPGEEGVLGPEFAIQSTQTALARINFAERVIFRNIPPNVNRPTGTRLDLSALEPLAADPAQLIGYLNDLLLHGTMTSEMNTILTAAISAIPETDLPARVKEAVYLVATSSQYLVQR